MNTATLVLTDEVNAFIDGVNSDDLDKIIKETALFEDGAHQTAAYKMKEWNGKSSNVSSSGLTYQYMLNDVYYLLDRYGYDIEIEDQREPSFPDISPITDDTFADKGYVLRYYQSDAVNAAIDAKRGIIKIPTSGGKTIVCGALCSVYDSHFSSITIVPSDKLAKQTYEDYVNFGLDTGFITGKVQGKKREAAWKSRHLVVTWQTLNRNRDKITDREVVIYDETHEIGDVMCSVLTEQLANAKIRIGLTATLPKSAWKKEKIYCHIGGEVIYTIPESVLQDEGHISTVDITMIPLQHEIDLTDPYGELDWDIEFNYLCNNKDRMEVIKEIIEKLPKKNTLILCHAMLGNNLAPLCGLDFIDKDTPIKIREEYYSKFDTLTDYNLVATFGTVGTGISINDIYQLVTIDVGKNPIRIIQGIGRGCRLDSKGINHLEVYDVYSTSHYSKKHLGERKSVYNKVGYDYAITPALQV